MEFYSLRTSNAHCHPESNAEFAQPCAELHHRKLVLMFSRAATEYLVAQSFGLLIGSILVAVEVVNGTKETSDFIFFITYLAQVYNSQIRFAIGRLTYHD